jgi:hypothetical protein
MSEINFGPGLAELHTLATYRERRIGYMTLFLEAIRGPQEQLQGLMRGHGVSTQALESLRGQDMGYGASWLFHTSNRVDDNPEIGSVIKSNWETAWGNGIAVPAAEGPEVRVTGLKVILPLPSSRPPKRNTGSVTFTIGEKPAMSAELPVDIATKEPKYEDYAGDSNVLCVPSYASLESEKVARELAAEETAKYDTAIAAAGGALELNTTALTLLAGILVTAQVQAELEGYKFDGWIEECLQLDRVRRGEPLDYTSVLPSE